MKIITVIPIARGILKDELFYFSKETAPAGALIEVPLRGRNIPALVIACQDAADAKADLKRSSFTLKKIVRFQAKEFFSTAFIKAAKETADYFAATTGAALYALTTKKILEKAGEFRNPTGAPKQSGTFERLIIQDESENRFTFYKNLIRESFAKKQSALIIVPTVRAAEKLSDKLKIGIEQYTFVCHSDLTPKNLLAAWKNILAENHPVAVIGTSFALSIPRLDFDKIIVEKENSPAYKTIARPFIDFRIAAELLAKNLGTRFFAGDSKLRTETLYRLEQGEFFETLPLKWHWPKNLEQKIIDMKKKPVLSDELIQLIKNNLEKNERLFIFAARRGLATSTVCSDCGATLTCQKCGLPLVLHRGKENYFLCHHCGQKKTAEIRCYICNSWKLKPLGVGTGKVAEEIAKRFPEIKIIRLDSDTSKTAREVMRRVADFEKNPGSILVGTELALQNINLPFDSAAVASLDSLMAMPNFRINEKIFSILLRLRFLARKNFLIQTRNPSWGALNQALAGDLAGFYQEELAERKKFSYPPFSIAIKITFPKNPPEIFSKWRPQIFGKNILLKLPPENWPNDELLATLRALPPDYTINIDPESFI
ncbi:MAG: primosomal protein N' [Candidatus Taylorbacteria bacterium RIFCSPHIGHO2_02_FULL_44_36]|uniref:Primosomal protein N n=1 Tax=Candidatus Taylorbacteria bacterium RIFCSPLOWO2_12_FULL_44_15c TaxID=1802333 RepID=A0A1G2P725_9BACT|nr:MAG: primosomal protein N' [Candidatus Taylorbacteria bacterium RIFCSPHIGHO2_02_FULL_44_36]OHA39253.1 MAG: primosomal protein N' [Candidatus Taylorbacteria bacterium RIFCSPLOWO2_02_FULL_44_35]OHA44128.1 MAG: primosomal protein N' [Candidatus Taylorbacteria bacterium RIFCSPLOWO2_12_FULL_44_15c]